MLAVIKALKENKIQIHTGEEVQLGVKDQLIIGIDSYLTHFYLQKQSDSIQVSFEPVFYLNKLQDKKVTTQSVKEVLTEEVKTEEPKEDTIELEQETQNIEEKEEQKAEKVEKPQPKKIEPKEKQEKTEPKEKQEKTDSKKE